MPELLREIEILKRLVADLLAWKEEKEKQQIAYPLDPSSKIAMGAAFGAGPGGTALTQVYPVVGGMGNVTAPKAYVRTKLLVVDGDKIEVPSLI